MFDATKMANHLKTQAELRTDPFPYIWIPEFFAPEVYQQALRELENFDAQGKVGYENRPGLELYDPPESELFISLKKCIRSEVFMTTLFGLLGEKPFGKFDVTFNREYFHIYLGPHLDNPPRRLSFQIYFPKDSSQEDLGTVLGVKDAEGFQITKRLPFVPNAGYAFISGPETWHSLPILENTGVPRLSLLYRWKEEKKIGI